MLVDSHCHLDFPRLAEDEAGVVERARQAGVAVLQTIGTRLSTFADALAIARRHEGVFCAVGVHPHHAGEEGIDDEEVLLDHAGHPKVTAIGESGLDFFYDRSPRDVQERSFRAHIQAARTTGLPIVIHTRDADEDMERILTEEMAQGAFSGVVHCYSSGRRLGEVAIELGMYLGIGGILTFPKSGELRATVRDMPLDRLLLETDSPYLAPVPKRGRPNEPAYVAHVAARLADVMEVSLDEIETVTSASYFRLFSRAGRPGAAA